MVLQRALVLTLWRDGFLLGFLDPNVQKNHLFPSLEGAKSLENQVI